MINMIHLINVIYNYSLENMHAGASLRSLISLQLTPPRRRPFRVSPLLIVILSAQKDRRYDICHYSYIDDTFMDPWHADLPISLLNHLLWLPVTLNALILLQLLPGPVCCENPLDRQVRRRISGGLGRAL